jgi:hypothetical protein
MKLLNVDARATVSLGSACVSHVGFGVPPKQASAAGRPRNGRGRMKEKSAMARTPSLTRETRALPHLLN